MVFHRRKVGIIVEDKRSDGEVIKKLLHKYELEAETIKQLGFNVRKFNVLGRKLRELGCEKVIVLRDTECKREEERYEELKEKINVLEEIEVCFAKCAMEAWLLADKEAIESIVGDKIKEKSNPESLENPKKVMEDIFRNSRGIKFNYNAPRDASKIADRIEVSKIEKK